MTPKTAICQVGHPGSLESLVTMLSAVGWDCIIPGEHLRDRLKAVGCDTVVSAAAMAEGWGDKLRVKCGPAIPYDMQRPDVVYVDTKAHRNGPKVWDAYPHLQKRTLWYRINGGEPDTIKGDEINPPCPVLTPDQWYKYDTEYRVEPSYTPSGSWPTGWAGRAYAMWPPFARWEDHQHPRTSTYTRPLCLVHNLSGYGYADLALPLEREVGLECYGGWGSPKGVFPHDSLPMQLTSALCMIHLKSVDAPGYAIYEAMASGCPVILPERFIRRCKAGALLEPGVTCLTFDCGVDGLPLPVETHHRVTCPVDVAQSVARVKEHVQLLRTPEYNRRIGEAGRERLRQVMWSPVAESSLSSLREFLGRMFP